ncbi:MAG: hypothetical protein ACYCZB_05980 [Acidiphilium sp.]
MRSLMVLASAGLAALSVAAALAKSPNGPASLVFQTMPNVIDQSMPIFGPVLGPVVTQTPPVMVTEAMPAFQGAGTPVSTQWAPNVVGQPMPPPVK